MDSNKIPEIKVTANKEREDGKKGGLLLTLSRLTAGAGRLGPLAAAASRGILATKAGVIGLALVVTTTAGGVGILGYKIFGPGPADRSGASYSLFDPKPKSSAELGSAEPAKAGGDSSPSINSLVKANLGSEYSPEARAQAEAAAKSASAGASEDSRPASASVGTGQNNNAAPGARPGGLLKTDGKIGQLSQIGAGAGSASAAGGKAGEAAGAAAKDLVAAIPKSGQLSGGMDKAAARPAAGRRALSSGMRSVGAFQQLGQVRQDQKGAVSSQKAGTTYDGNSVAGVGSAGAGAGIPQGGAGIDGSGAGRGTNPTVASNSGSDRFNAPPSVGGVNVTPWQKAINTAVLLTALAAVVLFALYKFKGNVHVQYPLAALGAVLGLAIIVLGSMMAGGAYGQTFQGNMFVLAGGFIIGASAAGGFLGASASEATDNILTAIMVLSGAAALGSAMWGYLSKPKVYSPGEFNNGKPPDIRGFSSEYKHPSEKYLEKFIVQVKEKHVKRSADPRI